MVCAIILIVCFRLSGCGMDDSDENRWSRSGLRIYTDYKTGVQYVGNSDGLCVRVDKDGKPVTNEQEGR